MQIKLRGAWARSNGPFVDAGQVADVDEETGASMIAGGFAVAVDSAAHAPAPADEDREDAAAIEAAVADVPEVAARVDRPKREKRG